MDLSSFALHELRKKDFNKEVWAPLRVAISRTTGKFGTEGYESTFYGLGSLAVPLEKVEVATKKLNWRTNGLILDHAGHVENSVYRPADPLLGSPVKPHTY